MANIFLATIKDCPQCGYRVEDPNAVRCPRCCKSLLKPGWCQGSCGNCRSKQEAVPGKCALIIK